MNAWHSVHVFQHGGHDRLITEAVAPEMAAQLAAGLVEDWFFLRYWDGGPHVRVRARPAPGCVELVRRGLSAALRDYLAANPTTSPVPPERYRGIADAMAAREGRTDHCRELYRPDSVVEIAYRPETEAYGFGRSLDAVERHFGVSSRLAVRLLAAGVPPAKRRGLALSMTVLTLAVLRPDASGLIGRPAQADGRGSGQVERVRAQIRRLWALAAGCEAGCEAGGGAGCEAGGGAGPDVPPLLSGWLAAVRDLHTELSGCAAAGALDVLPANSPLLWYLPDATAPEAVLARCTHLFANRIGIPITDEIGLNVLIARAIASSAAITSRGVDR